jgi:Trypsin
VGNFGAPSARRAALARGVALMFSLATAGCAVAAEGASTEAADGPVGEAAQAIQGGYRDDADRAIVGLAVTDDGVHVAHTCSGALIAPNLVLTARHCIARTSKFVSCDSSVFGAEAPAARVFVTFDASMWRDDTQWTSVAQVITARGADGVCGNDVALLRLDYPVTEKAVPLAPRLDRLAEPGEVYSAVGYGASAQGSEDAGLRRRRDALAVLCVGDRCDEQKQIEPSEWRGDHGICNGDSGGPAIDARGQVIGVTSRGPTGCDRPIYGSIASFRRWIRAEGREAARSGRYGAPEWATVGEGTQAESLDLDLDLEGDRSRACAVSATGPGARGRGVGLAGLVLLTSLLAAAWRRRRSTGPGAPARLPGRRSRGSLAAA